MHEVELVREAQASAKLDGRERAAVHHGEHDGIRAREVGGDFFRHPLERPRDLARARDAARVPPRGERIGGSGALAHLDSALKLERGTRAQRRDRRVRLAPVR